ncbi:MAG: hypothetical protein ACJ746_18400 [Bryobacteraceae bacterium]
MMRTSAAVLAAFLLCPLFSNARAETINAATCNQSDVQAAVNSASSGATVVVPAGNCTWTTLSINKALTFQGAGSGQTKIALNANPALTLTKQSSVITVTGFTFSCSANEQTPHPLVINGAWQGTKPVIFKNNAFNVDGCTPVEALVPGGVIFSHNSFTGTWDNALLVVKDASNATSWNTADSMGTRDTNGLLNVYVEDNTFVGGSNGVFDCDDNCRMVVRHNTFGYNGKDSGGFNSHGYDTSPYGMRHFEIYNNSFLLPDKTCTSGNTSLSNVNQWIWIRGGTGVVFDNTFDNLSSQCWGTKPEVRLSIRAAADPTLIGRTCSNISYPVPRQIGQNHNGTSYFTDPVYFWGNTGTLTYPENDDYGWTNTCSNHTWNNFFQWGRDSINNSIVAGNAKPGYTAYTYPHPLIQSTSPAPSSPTNLATTVH